jgi:hypothetical protein
MPHALALLSLVACLHDAPPVPSVDEPVPSVDAPTVGLIPEVGAAGEGDAPDAIGWDADFRALSLAAELRGDEVETRTVDAWTERVAGGAGPSGILPAGGYREGAGGSMGAPPPPSRARGAAAPSPEYAMADTSARPSARKSRGEAKVSTRDAAPLQAGKTDDNEAFGAFLEFLDTWTDRPGVAGNHVPMDVADRRFIQVTDRSSRTPVPGAKVTVVDRKADEVVWSGTTYGDGRAPFYADLAGITSRDLLVQARHGEQIVRMPWNGVDPVELGLDVSGADGAMSLDVVFVIDTTGSMSDEIARIKSTLLSVTERARSLEVPVDLQYGAVLYRDLGDAYLTRHTPLTRDVVAFDALLQGIEAGGGGDGPESLNQGLAVAVHDMDWREGAAKLMFVVADAPPHMDYEGDTPYADSAFRALTQGIRIHTVAASGLDDFGSLVFRQTAQLTRGDFVFIEYGSTAASAADHGVTGPVASNNLDGILFEALRDEVLGWGNPGPIAAR